MSGKGIVIAFALLLAAGIAAAPGAAEETEPPVNITADKMEYFSNDELVVFTGKALAVREDMTLAADRMEVTLAGGAEESEKNSVSSIVAIGNVHFKQVATDTGKERYATGDRGEYNAAKDLITLTGSPKLWEGQNVITGEVMKFHMEENRFVVDGGDNAPVGLTIYPDKSGKEEE